MKFEYVRDSGRISCEGTVTGGRAFGPFTVVLDPSFVSALEQVVEQSTGTASLSATLLLTFATLSLLLAAIGLYGVLSYLVTQRLTEIGIRIALGAQHGQVLRLVLLDGLRPVLLGLLLGLAGGASSTAARATSSAQPVDGSAQTFVMSDCQPTAPSFQRQLPIHVWPEKEEKSARVHCCFGVSAWATCVGSI